MKVYVIFGDSPRSDGENIEGIYFSKEKAKEDIKDLECCYFGEIKYDLEEFETNDEPLATPQPKIGRWISFGTQGEIDGQIVQAFTCSECGAISIFRVSNGNIVNGDLCPNCRAKMEDKEE